MSSVIDQRPEAKNDPIASELLISADSHVIEDPDLWVNRVAPAFKDRAPKFPPRKVGNDATFSAHEGGWDPKKRLTEMAVDGVRAEVLYPSLALTLFGMEDARLQEECFRVYNDWLMEYCQVAPHLLLGVACLSVYDIDQAVRELERCHKGGLRGALVWQVPHPDLPFTSKHYEKLWAAAERLQMPISLHILSGFGYAKNLFTLPMILEQNRPLADVLLKLHVALAFTLCALLVAHVGAALHHHFIRKDGVLTRMVPCLTPRDRP